MEDLRAHIQDSSSILIALPEDATDTDYLAALQLQKLAPDKTRIIGPEEKERAWKETFKDTAPQRKEFAIIVDTTLSPVEELRYEKDNGKLTIFLSHHEPFDRQAIRFEEHLSPADLIITLGFASREDALQATESLPKKQGIRHVGIGREEKPKLSPAWAGLLGRLMARSREDTDLGALWSFITRDDFVRTNSTPDAIPELVRSYKNIASLPEIIIIFWQYHESAGTEGIIWSSDENLISSVASRSGQIPRDKNYSSLPRFGNFIDAETTTRKLLQGIR